MPPIVPILLSISGRAWTCPTGRHRGPGTARQSDPCHPEPNNPWARAMLGPGLRPHGLRAKWPTIVAIQARAGRRAATPQCEKKIIVSLSRKADHIFVFSRAAVWWSHYQKTQNCRVSTCLPSVLFRTLGKQSICQVPTKKTQVPTKKTQQKKALGKEVFAECQGVGTRQTTHF